MVAVDAVDFRDIYLFSFTRRSRSDESHLGKPQFEKGRVYLGIAQMGGGLDPCPNGLGHLF